MFAGNDFERTNISERGAKSLLRRRHIFTPLWKTPSNPALSFSPT
jgi:hypothetical protein